MPAKKQARKQAKQPRQPKRVTRYTHDEVTEPRTPETGHTALMPGDEQVVSLPMDNGWSKALHVGKLPDDDARPVVIDMDPAADPVLFWAGKRNRREVAVLPLQRNEIVTESRIAQIIDRARVAANAVPRSQRYRSWASSDKAGRDRSRRLQIFSLFSTNPSSKGISISGWQPSVWYS